MAAGKPQGMNAKMNGYQMTDCPTRGGTFEVVTRGLLKKGFKLTWHGRTAGGGKDLPPDTPEDQKPAAGRRTRLSRPECRLNAWVRPGAKLT